MTQPAHQVCPFCAVDDDVQLLHIGDEWIFTCSNAGHPRYEWRPTVAARRLTYRSGIGEELGVYDALLAIVGDEWLEYGVIEHLFSAVCRKEYDFLVQRYGHTAIAEGDLKYSASAFLGGALGQLYREGLVVSEFGPATGYWSYNGQVGWYAEASTTAARADGRSWKDYAEMELRSDPATWPALRP
jgi:hypothetical protein